ncbi:hypothetical protein [Aquisalimonas asiatica]|uniref:Nickel/cobalt efflux system n=1 Tax=Aquisalimonas asiatica TaxID=406100 RepID=A0A1H8V8K6_9GAMM|nr:hypothetical protein [Aquisalimonas asiatica]SEP11765.1 hypothetical protein SAMN04488052_110108 [Aquisalimonas asiatica]
MTLGLIAAVIGIGLIHGVLPDHGWPIAATYALRRKRRYVAGAVAALVIGVGHLLSSIALVAIFLLLAGAYDLHEARWLSVAAGCMLVLLGIWQYLQPGRGTATTIMVMPITATAPWPACRRRPRRGWATRISVASDSSPSSPFCSALLMRSRFRSSPSVPAPPTASR